MYRNLWMFSSFNSWETLVFGGLYLLTKIFFCFLKIMLLLFDNFIQYILNIFSPFPHLLWGSPYLHIHPTSSSFCYVTKQTKQNMEFNLYLPVTLEHGTVPRVWLVVRPTSENTTRLASSASTSCEQLLGTRWDLDSTSVLGFCVAWVSAGRSYSCCHSLWEFICKSTLLCLEKKSHFLQVIQYVWPLDSLCPTLCIYL